MQALYQVVPRFIGTNAEYYHREEMNKLKTGGGRFVIIAVKGDLSDLQDAEVEFGRENSCSLYCRSDETFSLAQLKRIAAREYRAAEVKVHQVN